MDRTRRPQPFFHGRELTRLGMMILLLVLLFALILRTRDPHTFSHLLGPPVAEDAAPEENAAAPAANKPAEEKQDDKKAADAKPKIKEPENKSPTDKAPKDKLAPPAPAQGQLSHDPAEIKALNNELQVILDKSLQLNEVELHAYWRLMRWIQSEPIPQLAQEAQKNVRFNEYVRRPAELRGKLIRVNLNVRRVLKVPVQPDNPAGVKQLYEIWGASSESQAWLYVCITDQLPKGMPEGLLVNEKVTFYGYFLKLQGYHEGGAAPNANALFAPLLIGRMVWQAPVDLGPTNYGIPWWVWLIGAGCLTILLAVSLSLMGRRKPPLAPADGEKARQFEEWMANPTLADDEEGDYPDAEDAGGPGPGGSFLSDWPPKDDNRRPGFPTQ